MKTIITEDALDKIWDSSNKRVLELRELRNKYPVLVNQIDQLKREYIICLNSISIRDYNRIEETRKIINQMEIELSKLKNEYDANKERIKRAKQLKEESEETKNGE